MSVRRPLNSHIIALVVTVVLEIVIVLAFDIDFGFGGSNSPGEAIDEELFLDLENLTAEDFAIAPDGSAPASANENPSADEQEGDGAIKTQTTEAPQVAEPVDVVERNEPPVDSIVSKTPPVVEIKTDSLQPILVDAETAKVLSQMLEVTKSSGTKAVTSRKTQQEKYEFYKKNYRLIRNFQKVYPYAVKTREIIEEVNAKLATISSNSQKRKLIKDMEDRLFAEYEGAVRKMTVSQGKLLLKLISRETNKSGFELIKQYKGGFSAGFWYSVGKMFGTDLKTEYHRELEDSLIENVLDKYQKNELY